MVCYYFLIEEDPNSLLEGLKPTLSENLIRDSNKFLNLRDQLSFLLGRQLLLQGLVDCGFSVGLDQLKYTKWGKPYFDFDFDFSISHSKDIVAVLFSTEYPVGIDVQHHEEIAWDQYADYLSEREYDQVLSSKNSLRMFYEIWTMKEAISKAEGRGIEMMSDIDTCKLESKWSLESVDFHIDYSAHVCISGAGRKLPIHLKQFQSISDFNLPA